MQFSTERNGGARLGDAPLSAIDRELYARSAGKALGSLNAGSSAPKSFEELRSTMLLASDMGLLAGYTLFAWVTENIVSRYAATQQARRFVAPLFDGALVTAEICISLEPASAYIRIAQVETDDSEPFAVIRPGERDKAFQTLINWAQNEAEDWVKVSDQFFNPRELAFIQRIVSARPGLRFFVLTSEKEQNQEHVSRPWEDAYRDYWKNSLSDEEPPDIEVTVAGIGSSGKSPLHDRLVISKRSGLKLGTSLKSLGGDQECTITKLTEAERLSHLDSIDGCITRSLKQLQGEKVRYSTFNL